MLCLVTSGPSPIQDGSSWFQVQYTATFELKLGSDVFIMKAMNLNWKKVVMYAIGVLKVLSLDNSQLGKSDVINIYITICRWSRVVSYLNDIRVEGQCFPRPLTDTL